MLGFESEPWRLLVVTGNPEAVGRNCHRSAGDGEA